MAVNQHAMNSPLPPQLELEQVAECGPQHFAELEGLDVDEPRSEEELAQVLGIIEMLPVDSAPVFRPA